MWIEENHPKHGRNPLHGLADELHGEEGVIQWKLWSR